MSFRYAVKRNDERELRVTARITYNGRVTGHMHTRIAALIFFGRYLDAHRGREADVNKAYDCISVCICTANAPSDN